MAKVLKSGPLRMCFGHSGAKIRVFEQNTDIVEYGFCGGHFQRKVGGKFMRNSQLLLRTLGGDD